MKKTSRNSNLTKHLGYLGFKITNNHLSYKRKKLQIKVLWSRVEGNPTSGQWANKTGQGHNYPVKNTVV